MMQTLPYIAMSSVTGQMGSFIYAPNPILSHLALGVCTSGHYIHICTLKVKQNAAIMTSVNSSRMLLTIASSTVTYYSKKEYIKCMMSIKYDQEVQGWTRRAWSGGFDP